MEFEEAGNSYSLNYRSGVHLSGNVCMPSYLDAKGTSSSELEPR